MPNSPGCYSHTNPNIAINPCCCWGRSWWGGNAGMQQVSALRSAWCASTLCIYGYGTQGRARRRDEAMVCSTGLCPAFSRCDRQGGAGMSKQQETALNPSSNDSSPIVKNPARLNAHRLLRSCDCSHEPQQLRRAPGRNAQAVWRYGALHGDNADALCHAPVQELYCEFSRVLLRWMSLHLTQALEQDMKATVHYGA